MLTLSDLIISSHETLRSAMQRMTQNRKGILFVCDQETRLIGVISDGDVRRVLLDDSLLFTPVGKAMNPDPIVARTVEEASALIKRKGLVAVPVIDIEGSLKEALVDDGGDLRILSRIRHAEHEIAEMESLNALAIIPARGGSIRIPKKNLAMLAGRPLVAWAIRTAKSAEHVSHVVVSTDDAEIAEAAVTAGGTVPWLRPADLAKDSTSTLDVVLHALNWAVEALRPHPEFAVLLEPTAPLRLSQHVDDALQRLAEGDADSVISVSEVPHVLNPEELLLIENGLLRAYIPTCTMDSRRLRGQQRPVYVQNGLVYAFRIRSVLEQCSLYGRKTVPLIISWDHFVDIDTKEDLELASFKMRNQVLAAEYRS